MICPRCGTINPEGQERCTRCRGSLAPRPSREQRVPTSMPAGRPRSEEAGGEIDAAAEAWVAAPAPAPVTATAGAAEGVDAELPPVPAAAGGSGVAAPSAAPPPPGPPPPDDSWGPHAGPPPPPGDAWSPPAAPPPGAPGPPAGSWPPPPPGSQPLPHPWGPPATSPPPGWQPGPPPAPPNGSTNWRPRPPGLGAIPNYLGWSILCTLFFFTPAGLFGVISSIVARRRAARNDLDGAFRASRFARTCCWVSFLVGLVGYLLLASGVIKLPSSGV